jgi:hypothetical protein
MRELHKLTDSADPDLEQCKNRYPADFCPRRCWTSLRREIPPSPFWGEEAHGWVVWPTPSPAPPTCKTDRPAVFRIHDILVWIRIRIRGSMPLTNGSGFGSWCGSGSFYFHHWPSRCQQKKNFKKSFSAYYLKLFEGTFTFGSGSGTLLYS